MRATPAALSTAAQGMPQEKLFGQQQQQLEQDTTGEKELQIKKRGQGQWDRWEPLERQEHCSFKHNIPSKK